jgi:GLPGLI family protein
VNKVKLKGVVLIVICCIAITYSACTNFSAFDKRPSEGIIEYQVSFPYLYDEVGLLKSLLPDKMQLYFKREAYVSELSTVGGMFKNRFVSNQDDEILVHQLKVFKKRIAANYDTNGVNRLLGSLPNLTIIETNETDSIAGYHCKKAIGVFDDISMPEMTIYYTDDINILNPNWCTQFYSIPGVLMQYEVEQFGVRMRFRATSVIPGEVAEDLLIPEPGYEDVEHDALQTELELILDTFNL